MERTMTVDLDKMTDRVVEKALDEFTYNGKTIREWVELIVTAESVVEVRMVEEFKKIKAEIDNIRDVEVADGTVYVSSDDVYEILDKKIAELTGEQNDTN